MSAKCHAHWCNDIRAKNKALPSWCPWDRKALSTCKHEAHNSWISYMNCWTLTHLWEHVKGYTMTGFTLSALSDIIPQACMLPWLLPWPTVCLNLYFQIVGGLQKQGRIPQPWLPISASTCINVQHRKIQKAKRRLVHETLWYLEVLFEELVQCEIIYQSINTLFQLLLLDVIQ